MYLAKYLAHPTVTSISWQPFNISDTPAITICARPTYNPNKWAEYFATNFNGDEFLDGPDVSSRRIQHLEYKNGSFAEFVSKVGIPVVTQVTYCALGSTDIDCDPFPARKESLRQTLNLIDQILCIVRMYTL
jgi:hypothetical protein